MIEKFNSMSGCFMGDYEVTHDVKNKTISIILTTDVSIFASNGNVFKPRNTIAATTEIDECGIVRVLYNIGSDTVIIYNGDKSINTSNDTINLGFILYDGDDIDIKLNIISMEYPKEDTNNTIYRDIKIVNWRMMINNYDNVILTDEFGLYKQDSTGGLQYINIPSSRLDIPSDPGRYLVLLNINTKELCIMEEGIHLDNNIYILDFFCVAEGKGAYVKLKNIVDGYAPLEKRLETLEDKYRSTNFDTQDHLLVPKTIYTLNNSQLPVSAFSVSGKSDLCIIDSLNRTIYPNKAVDLTDIDTCTIYTGCEKAYITHKDKSATIINDSGLVEYEELKDYKFAIISCTDAFNYIPNKIFQSVGEFKTFDELVGIDTVNGLSPFMRIAGENDKKYVGDCCFRYTNSACEKSYSESDDKSGDFYIFDLRYYLIKNNIDAYSLTHVIVNGSFGDTKTGKKNNIAASIIYESINRTLPGVKIGIAPILTHYKTNIEGNYIINTLQSNYAKQVIDIVDKHGLLYNASIIPLWLGIEPGMLNAELLRRSVYNTTISWAYFAIND